MKEFISNWDKYKDLEYYPDRFCACGCGGKIKVKPYHKYCRIIKYINGHNYSRTHKLNCLCCICKAKRGETKGKNSPSFGKDHSGENNPMFGKSHSKEARLKQRKAKLGKYEGKNNPQHGKDCSGKNNNNWQGGISQLPYPFGFDDELKERIRERDNHTCQLCSKIEEQDSRNLCVHHIDYDKDNLDSNNLITLCRSCNGKVNGNRKYWTRFFNETIS